MTDAPREIAIKDIIVPEGRRPLDPEKVAEIAASVKAVGLLSPIGVHSRWGEQQPDGTWMLEAGCNDETIMLVWGAHRLAACKSLGWKTITVVDVSDDLDDCSAPGLKMMEIAENLHRAELTPQQRNECLAQWVALYEKTPPISDAEQPISSKPGRKPSRAVAAVAKMSGLGTKTVKEAIKSTKVSPAVKAAADDAELSQKQRLAIARLPEDKQIEAVAKQAAIDIDAHVAGLSDDDRRTLKSEIDLAYDWLRLVGAASPINRNTRSKQLVEKALRLVEQMTDEEREQFKTQLMEKYQW